VLVRWIGVVHGYLRSDGMSARVGFGCYVVDGRGRSMRAIFMNLV
jgi:hypothetical protein